MPASCIQAVVNRSSCPFLPLMKDNSTTGNPAAPSDEPAHAERLARQRQAALGLFARKMTHDLNNFATVVRTYSELLQAELPRGSSVHADATEIHRAADAMVAYLQRMVHFARATNARADVIDADAAAHEALQAFTQSTHNSAELRLVLVGTTGVRIHVDRAWLTDTITALVCNAREASASHQTVTVTLTMRASASIAPLFVLTVADHGAGFETSVSANAEDPFVTTKRGERGAGFGLANASAYARAAGGHIERERVNGETRVSLVLPCVE